MKRVLLLSYFFPEYSLRGGDRASYLLRELRDRGIDVTVVIATSGNEVVGDELIAVRDYSFSCRREMLSQKIVWLVLRIFQVVLNNCGISFSALSLWKRRTYRTMCRLFHPGEIGAIIATYPPLVSLELAIELRSYWKCSLISDFRDGLLFEPIEKKRFQKYGCYLRRAERVERRIIAASKAIVTVSPPISEYFRFHYENPPVVTISNGFDPAAIPPGRASLDLHSFHIVYTGTLGFSQEDRTITPLLKAIREVNGDPVNRKIKLHVAGILTAAEKRILKTAIMERDVFYHGHLSRRDAFRLQAAADLLLLVTGDNLKSIATGKLFEYLASGKMILNLGTGNYAERIIAETSSGWSVSLNEVAEMARLLRGLLAGTVRCENRNESEIAKFHWDRLGAQWAELLESVLSLN